MEIQPNVVGLSVTVFQNSRRQKMFFVFAILRNEDFSVILTKVGGENSRHRLTSSTKFRILKVVAMSTDSAVFVGCVAGALVVLSARLQDGSWNNK